MIPLNCLALLEPLLTLTSTALLGTSHLFGLFAVRTGSQRSYWRVVPRSVRPRGSNAIIDHQRHS